MVATKTIRVVVAKPGLDGHDRGARVIARALRDAGMEVIYTGLHQTPERIARACVDEDAEVCCLSILSGAHRTLVPEVIRMLAEQGRPDVAVLAGGIIPDSDIPELIKAGCKGVAGPGTSLDEIVEMVRKFAAEAVTR
ncbi:MAG: cobalamin B12-binding domain-containing protein [bacterium]|jgi:methylmalonyl-CoA mutase C-terminal domain/subunit